VVNAQQVIILRGNGRWQLSYPMFHI